jgi:predicted O-methyltransferase YrrM
MIVTGGLPRSAMSFRRGRPLLFARTMQPIEDRGRLEPFETTSPNGLRLRLRQAPNVLRRAVRHPDWISENVRGVMRRRTEARRKFSLLGHGELFVGEAEAVAEVSCSSPEAYWQAARDCGTPADSEPDDAVTRAAERPVYGGRPSLIRVACGIVRLCSPVTVIETGVAQGVTTAAILRAMESNGRGHLYSVDLPVLYADEEEFVGRLVPTELKHRWTLTLGPSRRVLPPLARKVAPLDMFLHDADHSYQAQLEEYRTVWPHLRPGGILLSDDIENPAFPEFAREVGARALLVGDPGGPSAIGLLRKPA